VFNVTSILMAVWEGKAALEVEHIANEKQCFPSTLTQNRL